MFEIKLSSLESVLILLVIEAKLGPHYTMSYIFRLSSSSAI